MYAPHKTSQKNQRGSVLVITVVSSIALLLMVGLVIDSAMLYGHRRDAVNAADSAALAAAMKIHQQEDDGTALSQNPITCSASTLGERLAVDEACLLAIELGHDADKIQIAIPPVSGELIGTPPEPKIRVQVMIESTYNTSFMQIAGIFETAAHASAVAEVDIHEGAPPPVNFFALDDEDDCETLKFNWGGSVDIEAGMQVNSTCPDKAVVLNGTAKFCAPSLKTNGGGIEFDGNNINIGNCGGKDRTGVDTNSECKGDPYRNADFEIPDFQNPPGDVSIQGGTCSLPQYTTISSGFADPGIYYGGLKLDGSADGMNPGIYYVVGGGVTIAPSTSFDALGVTIINTADPSCNGDAGVFGTFELNSSANIDFSAPNSGPTAGMLFMHRSILPNCDQVCGEPLEGSCTNDINDAEMILNPSAHLGTGSFYAPDASIKLNPSANITTTSLFIGETIEINNSAHMTILYGEDDFFVGEGGDSFVLLVE